MVEPRGRVFRAVYVSLLAALLLCLGACGDSGESSAGAPDGPDTSDIQNQLLAQINIEAGGLARITQLEETGRKIEGSGDFQSCQVTFQGEIEFTDDTYYHMSERKKGDRTPFEAEAEFIKDRAGWKRATLGIHPRG